MRIAGQDKHGKPIMIEVDETEDVTIITNAETRELRQRAYLTESDPLLMAIQSYERRGEISKANALTPLWLEKIEEINERYPYND